MKSYIASRIVNVIRIISKSNGTIYWLLPTGFIYLIEAFAELV